MKKSPHRTDPGRRKSFCALHAIKKAIQREKLLKKAASPLIICCFCDRMYIEDVALKVFGNYFLYTTCACAARLVE